MNRLKKIWKQFHLSYDILISIFGIALIIFLFLSIRNPEKRVVLLAAFISGGSINILNGLKIVKDKKKRNTAMSYILFGVLIILFGFIMINQVG